MDKKKLTAENGRPIADNQNIQTAGKRGPVTLQAPWFLEKLAHFDREVIPERRMHAKGSGACLSAAKIDYQSITEKAHSFTHINVKTVRFLPLPN